MHKSCFIITDNPNSIYVSIIKRTLEEELLTDVVAISPQHDFIIKNSDESSDSVLYVFLGEDGMNLLIKRLQSVRTYSQASFLVLFADKADEVIYPYIKQMVTLGNIAVINIQHIAYQELKEMLLGLKKKKYILSDDIKEQILDYALNDKSVAVELENSKLHLNQKEKEILSAAIRGCNIQQTAEVLNLSSNTVAVYRSKIVKRANVKSIFELIAKLKNECNNIHYAPTNECSLDIERR